MGRGTRHAIDRASRQRVLIAEDEPLIAMNHAELLLKPAQKSSPPARP